MRRLLPAAVTWALLAVVWSLLLAGGCADTGPPPPGAWSRPPASSTPPADPVRVEIPAVDAASTLVPLNLDANGALDVPTTAKQAGWYAGGVKPGAPGPAVIVGHIDYRGEPGVFQHLAELHMGDEVWVATADATVLRFEVYAVERYDKADFDTEGVYGDTPGPELRLITCGGAFDRVTRHYTDNVVVFARLAT